MKEPGKASVYVGKPLVRLLQAAPKSPRSARINRVADQYMDLVEHELARIRWTREEWSVVLEANSGEEFLSGKGWSLGWGNVAESPKLGARWGVDVDDLASKYRGLSLSAKLAVHEATVRFWQVTVLDVDERMKAAGIVPAAA